MNTRLTDFVWAFSGLLDRHTDESKVLLQGAQLLQYLLVHDDWLPSVCARPNEDSYSQYLLHNDPRGRFSVVSFVWGPGQRTPVHDHTVWGLIGMLRGSEIAQPYSWKDGVLRKDGRSIHLMPGMVEAVSPRIGDVHRVSNAFDDQVSISIHVYGANIGEVQRFVYLEDGTRQQLVSGYTNVESSVLL